MAKAVVSIKVEEKSSDNPFLRRWKPDFRYCSDKFDFIRPSDDVGGFVSTDPTVTDTEAYRLTLASARADMASAKGSPSVGSYSIPAGQEYDPKKDFSYLYRPDLSLVELDEYIERFRKCLEDSDASLSERIKAELAAAEERRKEMAGENNADVAGE